MQIHFDEMEPAVISHFYGGEKKVVARMFSDDKNRIMYASLEKGASIGLHSHDNGSEIIYVTEGAGKAVFDGKEERLSPGMCHDCPKGHSHALMNDGEKTLVFFAVVPVQ